VNWRSLARCREEDPELFFPGPGQSGAAAKRICLTLCEVREQCLAWAMEQHEEFGIWGGLGSTDRRETRSSTPAHAAR
jgi:WhiB family redox-sensing transcriptional regulator